MLLMIAEGALTFLFLLLALFWITPVVMLIVGLTRLKSRPKNAKNLIIIAGIWLVVGLGSCGSMFF